MDLDEEAHYELPPQDLCCSQIRLFFSSPEPKAPGELIV